MYVVYISKDEKACIVADDYELRNGKLKFKQKYGEDGVRVVAMFNMDAIVGFDDLSDVDDPDKS